MHSSCPTFQLQTAVAGNANRRVQTVRNEGMQGGTRFFGRQGGSSFAISLWPYYNKNTDVQKLMNTQGAFICSFKNPRRKS